MTQENHGIENVGFSSCSFISPVSKSFFYSPGVVVVKFAIIIGKSFLVYF